MKVELRLDRRAYAISEDVTATVRVTNDGTAPVEIPDPFNAYNWQPTYTLFGPKSPAGSTFSFRSAVRKDPRPNPPDVEPVLITLAPGEEVEGEIPLAQWTSLDEPGTYRLTATLEWKGARAASQPVAFDVEPFEVLSVSLGIDAGVPSAREPWVAWLRRGNGAIHLGQTVFQELRPDLAEIRRISTDPVATVGPDASDVLSPWTRYDRKEQMTFWRAWREGSTLLAWKAGASTPDRLDLGFVPEILGPALMRETGELDVVVIDPGSRTALARFAPGTAPRLLPGPLLGGRFLSGFAAQAPTGAERHVIATMQRQDGMLVLGHAKTDAAGALGPLTELLLPGLRVLPRSVPAARVDQRGALHVDLLVLTSPDGESFGVVDALFEPGRDARSVTTELGRLPGPATAARASHPVWPGAAPRTDWAVLLESGELISHAHPTGQRLPAPAAVPLELLSLSQATYVLALDPRTGPLLVPLR